MMIMVEALIRPQKVHDVKQALLEIGVKGWTLTEVRGSGNQKGFTHHYRGAEYNVNLLQRIKIEVVVLEREARVVADAIIASAFTGEVGDGKVFLIPVSTAIRIRTGEDGRDAVE